MHKDDFEQLLGLVTRLDVEQKARLQAALAAGEDEAAVVE